MDYSECLEWCLVKYLYPVDREIQPELEKLTKI